MTKKASTSRPSPILFICLVCLLGYFTINVIQTMTDGYNYQDRVETLERQVQNLSKQKQELNHQLEYVQSKQFIEEEARNKLHLARPSEKIVIFPQNSAVLSAVAPMDDQQESTKQRSLGHTDKWLELFFE